MKTVTAGERVGTAHTFTVNGGVSRRWLEIQLEVEKSH